MSGRKIDDHGSWMGSKGKASVFPDGPHKVKMESSASQVGGVSDYQDTTEAIKHAQEEKSKKIRSHQGKLPVYKN
jgi:hypothetical protein